MHIDDPSLFLQNIDNLLRFLLRNARIIIACNTSNGAFSLRM